MFNKIAFMLYLHCSFSLFLSRNVSDEEDSHQRICLHVEILTPLFGIVSGGFKIDLHKLMFLIIHLISGACVCLTFVTYRIFTRKVKK